MTPKRVLDILITVAIAAAIFIGIIVLLRVVVGDNGVDLPALDVVFVPQEWFVPSRVAPKGEATVYIEGSSMGLEWTGTGADREWVTSGSTLVLPEANEQSFPVPDDGRVIVEYTFGGDTSLGQAAGWRVVKIEQRDDGVSKRAAFVIVDLTRQVWLRRMGPVQWTEVPME
ncbi:MAG: hypothetical protein ACYC77_11220 [Coriobacteriia bacterium]